MNRYPESSADGGPWRPAWADRDDIGEAVPHSFVLGRSKRSAAAVSGIVAYREGFVFDVMVRIRDADPSLSMLADDGIMFAAHWPQVDVSFSTSIDGQPIIDAAQRSRSIWE